MDLYIVLGIERAATLNDIKRAYKRLARKCHPDINPGDRLAAQQFRQIADAYETLSDPDRRRQYDAAGRVIEAVTPVAFGFDGFDFSVSANGSAASTFRDLFSEVLAAPFASGQPLRGTDVYVGLTLTLEQACVGGSDAVTLTRHERCATCAGLGQLRVSERRCGACQGTGAVRSARGHMVFSKPCPNCRGTGALSAMPCTSCHGRQTELRAETVRVQIPPGVNSGDQLRISGKGHAGRNGGDSGDLILNVQVAPHSIFRRDGDDLGVNVPVAVHEAALGAKIDVPSIDGQPARVRVPPGTQSGQRFRLRERGMPSLRGTTRGDLIVEVRIVLPPVLDERSKDLLREFGRINAGDVRRATVDVEGRS